MAKNKSTNRKKGKPSRMYTFARFIANWGVRECIEFENLHKGMYPSSKKGNYSDVKVISPYGEIPWKKLCRISDEEMHILMLAIEKMIHRSLYALAELEKMYPSADEFEDALEKTVFGSNRISWDLGELGLKEKYGENYKEKLGLTKPKGKA